ncbi:hypothetical protein AGOR_G00132540 [Albula goreensis]|uniref:Stabilin 2 n=1 Tax=Albula goreensis TaxID=1534307 RepID=A0A8T3DBW4_9TELE|nr:hypothetical protein AGOR_G00132540 [Albula goreensis]
MFPLLLLVVMVTCNAQHPQGRCDEVQTVRLFSPCTSCAIVQSTSCPRDSRLVTKATESTNCRYKVEIGGKVKMVPGCSHTCEKKVMKPRCCPDTWGPLCVPCPTWNGRMCNWHGTCVDGMTGNGTCVCEAGFSGFACQECKNKNTYGEHCDSQCKCVHGQCNNGPSGDGECYCQPPYTGPRCDQVSTSCKACSAYSYCKQSGGAEACECLPGFKKVGHTCTGDMCSRDVCDQNADCTNLDGGHYQCRCKVGYEGNGRVCVPLNPCASNHGDCPFNSTLCVYTAPGRSHCVCRHGFEGSTPEMGCTLKSACRQNTCHRTARCQTGMDGLPRCTCGAQEIGDGRRCYGNILDRLLELNRDGPQKGNLTGAIGCLLTLSKHGPFTAFIPVLRYPLNGVSESFLCKNHLVLQQNVLKDLQGKDFWTLGLEGLRFRNNEKFLFKKDPYTMYSVIQSDIAASNGIIHIISGPITNLQPPTSDSEQIAKQTVGEILVNDPKYKSFQLIWDNSGISFNLRGPGPFTVFVPTNSALDKFSHNTEYMQDQARHKLHTLLRHHVTTGSMASVEELAATDSFQSEANDRIYINIRQDGRLEFDEAGVHLEAGDIVAANGIIHVIDGVLVPPSILPIMPHRCDVTENRIMLGFCKSCDHVNETHCPANSIQLEGSPLGCAYLSIPDNVSTKGCTQLCNITKTRSDCCKGFYGNDCKPCVGGFQHPCYDKGQCVDGIHGNGSCICEPEYTGLACHICTDEKKYGENCDLDCRCVHGVCDHKRNSSGLCKPGSCQSGFSGDMCEMKITECSEYQTETCHYLADCVQNVTGQPACVCRAGYEGDGSPACLSISALDTRGEDAIET